jgi:hypothetical protein
MKVVFPRIGYGGQKMATKRKSQSIKGIIKLILIFSNVTSLISNLARLVSLEARLAGRSILSVVFFAIFFSILLAASWACVLALIYVYFVSLHWSPMETLFLMVAINLLSLLIMGLIISRVKKNILFPETCQQLHNLFHLTNRK